MVATWAGVALITLLPAGTSLSAPPTSNAEPSESDRLSMSPGVVCRDIVGYEDYEPLPNAALTSDEKLLIYFRPHRYAVDRSGDTYHIHLTQEGQVRRRGEKAVIYRKEKLLDYEWKGTKPPGPVYLRNTIAIKGLKPGDYDFDITLRDKFSKDPAVTQTVQFRVVLPAQTATSAKTEPEPTHPSPKKKEKARRVAPSRPEN